jgi:hypothetical protein
MIYNPNIIKITGQNFRYITHIFLASVGCMGVDFSENTLKIIKMNDPITIINPDTTLFITVHP